MQKAAIYLVLSALVLYLTGLLMVFSTTAAEMIDRAVEGNTHLALYKQMAYSWIGVGAGFCVYRMGYRKILAWSVPILIGITILLLLVYIPGIGLTLNGARRWLSLFGFSFQPSECAKVMIPAAFIHWVVSQKGEIEWRPFCKVLFWLSIPTGLILMEPDNGTTAIVFAVMVVLFGLTQIRWKYWALPLLFLTLLGGGVASQMPHVKSRIQVFLHPEQDLKGKGHQPHQAKIAAGCGGWFGRGWGESLQKLNYLPEARSDYIAAIFAEETGFMGMLFLIGLYTTFTYAGCAIALQAKEKGAFLLASIWTFLLSIQAFLNLGIVSGLLPSKGMTLPFFSQGGTSMMMNVIVVFLLLQISSESRKEVVT
jgi:cell division protein FtsW